jgi:hypothetical protein
MIDLIAQSNAVLIFKIGITNDHSVLRESDFGSQSFVGESMSINSAFVIVLTRCMTVAL